MITSRDVQADKEGFPKIPIEKVGIKNIELPIWIKDHDGEFISTIANVSSYCDLIDENKGINMSRIPRTIFDVFKPSNKKLITELSEEVVHELQLSHETSDIYFKARFKYPFFQRSPSTNLPSPEIVNVVVETTLKDGIVKKYLTVEMVGMSLCPCSKDMSMLMNNLTAEETLALVNAGLPASLKDKIEHAGFGAHNQKSFVNLKVEIESFIDIEDIIKLVNSAVSATVFSVLKRPDEKFVTEMSYMGGYINEDKEMVMCPEENAGPKFVEDIARQLAEEINFTHLDEGIKDYVVTVRNAESIHSNNIEAVAILRCGRDLE